MKLWFGFGCVISITLSPMFKILHVFMLLLAYLGNNNMIPECTAVFDSQKNAVIIRWQHRSSDIKTYIIQCSTDNKLWADIALQGVSLNTGNKAYYFEDRKPQLGENYYRLKSVSVNGNIEYSLSMMVIIASPADGWIMYPVPVQDVLTLKYNGAEKIKGVINVFIQAASGKIITRVRSASLNKIIQIPVTNLVKGIYDIRIIIEGEIVWNQRFIK